MDAFEAISLPDASVLTGKKHFSVDEANRALVLIRRIVSDIVRNYSQLRDLHEAYQSHEARGNLAGTEEARRKYVATTDHLSELREELEEIGCELKDYEVGLVDFPALLDGRGVYLCWRLGESKVEHWHEVADGAAGRRPIAAEWL